MKRRIDPDHVQPGGPISVFRRDQIHLERGQDLVGNVVILTVKRLATNDDELLFASDATGSPQHMIKLMRLHSVFSLPPWRVIRQAAPTGAGCSPSRRVRSSLRKALRQLPPLRGLAIPHRRPPKRP